MMMGTPRKELLIILSQLLYNSFRGVKLDCMYKVSILVPIYKVERFIDRCVKSLFGQTYPELEFIFVNDCTPDNSVGILMEALKNYPQRSEQFRLIEHDHNRGLAASRNTALDNATGEFVCVVDSDDWLEINAIELLVNRQIETGADIVTGNMMMHKNEGDIPFFEKVYSSKEDFVLQQLEKTWDHTIYRKLIRRSLFELNNIRCIEGYNMTEDRYQMAQLAYFADSYSQINDIIYHYERRNENSIMAQKDKERILRRDYEYLQNWLGIRDFFSDKEVVYSNKANVESMRFAKQYLISIVKLNSKQWYYRIADILDQEVPENQELAGWTTKGIKGRYLHSFFWVELNYQRERMERFVKLF